MKTKFNFFLTLVIVSTILANCTKEETNTGGKKYFISKEKYDDGSYSLLFYNVDNNLSRMEFKTAGFNSSTEFIYDSKNYLTQINYYTEDHYNPEDSILIMKNILVMKSDYNISKNIWYFPDMDTITSTFEYDINNNLSKINYYHGDMDISSRYFAKTVLTFNSSGNVIKEVYTDSSYNDTVQYDYEYDLKISPYSQNSLKWVYLLGSLQIDNVGYFYYLSKNNPIKKTRIIPTPIKTTNFTYNYNGDGYPTRITEGASVTDLEYIVK